MLTVSFLSALVCEGPVSNYIELTANKKEKEGFY